MIRENCMILREVCNKLCNTEGPKQKHPNNSLRPIEAVGRTLK